MGNTSTTEARKQVSTKELLESIHFDLIDGTDLMEQLKRGKPIDVTDVTDVTEAIGNASPTALMESGFSAQVVDGRTLMSMMNKGGNLLPTQSDLTGWVYIEKS